MSNKLNVVFMGTPDFAISSLKALANSEFCPSLVVTQPDKPKGRKKILSSPIIKDVANSLSIPCIQPVDVNLEIDKLGKPDVIIVVAYGAYLKKAIRTLPKYGCLNLHPSLLPRWRGAAPMNFTLFAGDEYTGNTIFKIVAKMDAGPICFQNKFKIDENQNLSTLSHKLSTDGALNIIKVLQSIKNNTITYTKQNHSMATFTSKITSQMMQINFLKPSKDIINLIKGLAEKPAAYTFFKGKKLKIISAELTNTKSTLPAGDFIMCDKNGILIAGSDYNILLKQVQAAGKKIMNATDFANGARLKKGDSFATPA